MEKKAVVTAGKCETADTRASLGATNSTLCARFLSPGTTSRASEGTRSATLIPKINHGKAILSIFVILVLGAGTNSFLECLTKSRRPMY